MRSASGTYRAVLFFSFDTYAQNQLQIKALSRDLIFFVTTLSMNITYGTHRILITSLLLTIGLIATVFLTTNILQFSIEALNGTDPYDFPNYYFSGLRLLEGRPIYDHLDQELLSKFGWIYNTYMADPPFTVTILTALSFFGYSIAWWIFLILSILSIAISLGVLLRKLGLSSPYIFALTSLVLASQSALYLFKRNHLEGILFLGLSSSIVFLQRRNNLAASIILGTISAIKIFPAFILLTCFRRLGTRNFLIGCSVMMGLSLVGVVVCDFGDPSLPNLKQYITEVLSRSVAWLGTIGNFSLRSLWVAFGAPPQSINPYYLVSATIVFLAAMTTGNSKEISVSTCLLTGTAASLLLSPLAWLNYLIILVPPVAYFYFQHHKEQPRRARQLVLLVAIAIYWPTYLDVLNPTVTKLVSLLPTLIMFFIVLEPHLHGRSYLLPFMNELRRRCSNWPR